MTGGQSGIFVSHRALFEGGRGGAQICSEEYFDTISAAGISLDLRLLDIDRRLSTRVLRRLGTSPYDRVAPPEQIAHLTKAIADSRPDFVFLNQVNLAGLAASIRPVLHNEAKIVVLSHGLESTDLLHGIRVAQELELGGIVRRTPRRVLAQTLLKEASNSKHVDGAFVLSRFDEALEMWLGQRAVAWLPRTIANDRLDWRPSGNRLGFLGTIDHAPNLEGLVRAMDALEALRLPDPPRIRVIGGPPACGAWLQDKYASIDYLGPLSLAEARAEAQTWSAFLHPIFCAARGCSTKLAEAIGWGLPIITTELGHRGYAWREGALLIGNTPAEFAQRCVEVSRGKAAGLARADVLRILATSPTRAEVAGMIRAFLDGLSKRLDEPLHFARQT